MPQTQKVLFSIVPFYIYFLRSYQRMFIPTIALKFALRIYYTQKFIFVYENLMHICSSTISFVPSPHYRHHHHGEKNKTKQKNPTGLQHDSQGARNHFENVEPNLWLLSVSELLHYSSGTTSTTWIFDGDNLKCVASFKNRPRHFSMGLWRKFRIKTHKKAWEFCFHKESK